MSKTEYSKKHFMFNKRLHGAYILAGFAVQRERIEGLPVFSKIAVECFSLFTEHREL